MSSDVHIGKYNNEHKIWMNDKYFNNNLDVFSVLEHDQTEKYFNPLKSS